MQELQNNLNRKILKRILQTQSPAFHKQPLFLVSCLHRLLPYSVTQITFFKHYTWSINHNVPTIRFGNKTCTPTKTTFGRRLNGNIPWCQGFTAPFDGRPEYRTHRPSLRYQVPLVWQNLEDRLSLEIQRLLPSTRVNTFT
jgi:hypothetical protein